MSLQLDEATLSGDLTTIINESFTGIAGNMKPTKKAPEENADTENREEAQETANEPGLSSTAKQETAENEEDSLVDGSATDDKPQRNSARLAVQELFNNSISLLPAPEKKDDQAPSNNAAAPAPLTNDGDDVSVAGTQTSIPTESGDSALAAAPIEQARAVALAGGKSSMVYSNSNANQNSKPLPAEQTRDELSRTPRLSAEFLRIQANHNGGSPTESQGHLRSLSVDNLTSSQPSLYSAKMPRGNSGSFTDPYAGTNHIRNFSRTDLRRDTRTVLQEVSRRLSMRDEIQQLKETKTDPRGCNKPLPPLPPLPVDEAFDECPHPVSLDQPKRHSSLNALQSVPPPQPEPQPQFGPSQPSQAPIPQDQGPIREYYAPGTSKSSESSLESSIERGDYSPHLEQPPRPSFGFFGRTSTSQQSGKNQQERPHITLKPAFLPCRKRNINPFHVIRAETNGGNIRPRSRSNLEPPNPQPSTMNFSTSMEEPPKRRRFSSQLLHNIIPNTSGNSHGRKPSFSKINVSRSPAIIVIFMVIVIVYIPKLL